MSLFRRKSPPPEINGENYSRWLRAHRPPFEAFIGLTDLEQEALAAVGDAHSSELVEALAMAVGNAEALTAGVDARAAAGGDVGAEETLARQLAAGMASRLSGIVDPNRGGAERAVRATMPRETLAGFGERHVEEHDHGPKPRLFGREADAQ